VPAAHRICERLEISDRERVTFLASVAEQRAGVAPRVDPASVEMPASRGLDHEVFQVVSDLHHYAILEMTFLGRRA
jgi:hypothetical protein